MILPIVAYGDPVLKKVARPIPNDGSTDVQKLSEDMFETMYNANGVGLAGPQVGLNQRIFVVAIDGKEDEEGSEVEPPFKETFINAQMLDEEGTEWTFEEGCLSIPNIHEKINRKPRIRIRYFNVNWEEKEISLDGMKARVVQHEYDHIEGTLFTDYLSPLKKQLLKNKLTKISQGKVKHDYQMKFPKA